MICKITAILSLFLTLCAHGAHPFFVTNEAKTNDNLSKNLSTEKHQIHDGFNLINTNNEKFPLKILSVLKKNFYSFNILISLEKNYEILKNNQPHLNALENKENASEAFIKIQRDKAAETKEKELETITVAKKYIDANKGNEAIEILYPLLKKPNYIVWILTAQSYAILEKPKASLDYFNKAFIVAKTLEEKKIASAGIIKMQKWLSAESSIETTEDAISIHLAKKYVNANQGKEALEVLQPLLETPNYNVFILIAKSYAILEDPKTSLEYFRKAFLTAKNLQEEKIAYEGVVKMKVWMSSIRTDKNELLSEVAQFINKNKGKKALSLLFPLLKNKPEYKVFILTAQSYAVMEKPQLSLAYFNKAHLIAKTQEQKKIAEKGMLKMQKWISENSVESGGAIHLVKQYIDSNKGKEALELLKPLLDKTVNYYVYIVTAQSYAIMEKPQLSLDYFKKARLVASTDKERKIADEGILKMEMWLAETIRQKNDPIHLVKKLIDSNKGEQAWEILKTLLTKTPTYEILVLSAQSYAIMEKPQLSLDYFKKARLKAKTDKEKKLTEAGMLKMRKWLKKNSRISVSPFDQDLNLAKKYIKDNKGGQALEILISLLDKKITFDALILTAQSYAIINKPYRALCFYKTALEAAKNQTECSVANFGVGKMQFWVSRYLRAQYTYSQLLLVANKKVDFEKALAGLVKSMAYINKPMLSFKSMPEDLIFTLPEMVIAAAQASLWSDWADITKNIVIDYDDILQKIPPKSPLLKDLKDLTWQMNQATWLNILTPTYFYSKDSEDFGVQRELLDYTHYWSQTYQSNIGLKGIQYSQQDSRLRAKSVYFLQTIRPTRHLIFNAALEPSNFKYWNPTLWLINGNYQPNDYVRFYIFGLKEIVETFPAFLHKTTDTQSGVSLYINPLPYTQFNGSIYRLNFNDTNQRNGYYLSGSYLILPSIGLKLMGIERSFRSKFVSPYYFSPNYYVFDTFILRLGSKAGDVWHYYLDGGLGSQIIKVTGIDSSRAPTYQWGCGINGPISKRLILSAYYLMTTQASSFRDSPNYRYQSGAISLKILL